MTDFHVLPMSDILDNVMLPDPTKRVPYDQFFMLKESDDMLQRAAFWCFYAASLMDTPDRSDEHNEAIRVQARHDGHTIRAVTHELVVREAVMLRLKDIYAMEQTVKRHTDAYGRLYVGLLLAGMFLGFLLCGALVVLF